MLPPLLSRKLAGRIRTGRLVVRGLAASDLAFGTRDPQRPHLDVAVRIRDRRTARRLALRPDLHVGEAYMDGSLAIERGSLRDFLELCFINLPDAARTIGRQGRASRLVRTVAHRLQQRNFRWRARRNVAHHYDLSDELYRRFLDDDRQYSCAYFAAPDMMLEEAQAAKKDHICRKLLLRPGQRVLDIGCGWGGLALTLGRRGAGQVTGSPSPASSSPSRADGRRKPGWTTGCSSLSRTTATSAGRSSASCRWACSSTSARPTTRRSSTPSRG